MPIEQFSPHFAIVKELPRKKDDFGTAERSGHWTWLIPQLLSSLFQAMDVVAKHTAGHAEVRKMKLPVTACSLRIPFGIGFHCGLTLQESKRWPCAGEISGVKKLRLCSFRWGTAVRRVFAQSSASQTTPEKVYNGMAWILDLSWMMILNCMPFLGCW